MKNRITPEKVLKPKQNEVFVYGSNLLGQHRKGAAADAVNWGAKWGQGVGLAGRTYGIPTKGRTMQHILRIDEIKLYVENFISFAESRPDLTFLVTEIGCGRSKYDPKDIAPLFKRAVKIDNIWLPKRFWKYLE